ncbi:unnamed protein product [Meloidogyne enterolobii]|uniref:Uncharacterized protein n=1 Tax=Meloidogyne enterolobii TaxID=390850 RepID=A0ACB0YK11_MELEN
MLNRFILFSLIFCIHLKKIFLLPSFSLFLLFTQKKCAIIHFPTHPFHKFIYLFLSSFPFLLSFFYLSTLTD